MEQESKLAPKPEAIPLYCSWNFLEKSWFQVQCVSSRQHAKVSMMHALSNAVPVTILQSGHCHPLNCDRTKDWPKAT